MRERERFEKRGSREGREQGSRRKNSKTSNDINVGNLIKQK